MRGLTISVYSFYYYSPSTVGIAMGAAGSDVALETADIALMANRLDNLPFAIGLSRQSRRIIKQNLVISLGMVAVLIPTIVIFNNVLTTALWSALS
jgi:cation transport ATPase